MADDSKNEPQDENIKPSFDRKVILYIAMSLDGYIAKPDGDLGFLSMVEQEGEDYGYTDFIKTVDTVIVGRKTYDKVLSMGYELPYGAKAVYVITRSLKPSIGQVEYYMGNLKDLIHNLKSGVGKHIFVDGGAEIVNELLNDNLIDEFYISVIPVLLGEGLSLFKSGRPQMELKLNQANYFDKGLVQLHYIRVND